MQDNEFTGCAPFSQQIRALLNFTNRRRKVKIFRVSLTLPATSCTIDVYKQLWAIDSLR
jgi:hypothetical protein